MSTSSAACSLDRVTTIRRPESGRSSYQRRCERNPTTAPTTSSGRCAVVDARGNRPERALDGPLRGERRVVDERGGLLLRAAVRHQRLGRRRDLPRARVADERAADPRQPAPVNRPRGPGFALVAADESQHIARAGVRHRNAGVGRAPDGHGDAGDHLERDALLVQEQRLLPAAVEDERVAPLQPHDRLAFARLLGQQQADRILFQRFRRRRADVDALRVRPGGTQQPRVDAVIVDDDVGRFEVALAANGDQRRIAGARSDDVDAGLFHWNDLRCSFGSRSRFVRVLGLRSWSRTS